jgi:hypothetical protein
MQPQLNCLSFVSHDTGRILSSTPFRYSSARFSILPSLHSTSFVCPLREPASASTSGAARWAGGEEHDWNFKSRQQLQNTSDGDAPALVLRRQRCGTPPHAALREQRHRGEEEKGSREHDESGTPNQRAFRAAERERGEGLRTTEKTKGNKPEIRRAHAANLIWR